MTDWNLVSSICKEMLFGKYFRIGIVFGVNIGLFFSILVLFGYTYVLLLRYSLLYIYGLYIGVPDQRN